MPEKGFDLKTASREVRKCAKALGILSGRWEPVYSRAVDALDDDEVVARVWNTRKSVDITAWDIRYAGRYLYMS